MDNELVLSEKQISLLIKRTQENSIRVPQGLSREERRKWASKQLKTS